MDKSKYKEIRERLGYNYSEMAQILGVSHQSVSAWERGLQQPSTIHQVVYRRLEERLNEETGQSIKSALIGAGVMGFLLFLFSGDKK